jgi:spermidine/putrescine transport system permease protein
LRAGRRRQLAAFGLTAPAYLWLLLTIFLPLCVMLFFSFLTKAPFGGREIEFTLDHYVRFFERDFYLFLTWRSLLLGAIVTAVCIVVGYPAAFLLAKKVKGRWREALFLLIILPFWSNALVRVFSWTMVLRASGTDILYSYAAVLIGLVHSYLPYMILTCYLSLQAIDDSLVEAARSLGAPPAAVWRRIILPLSLPGLVTGSILIFIPVVGSFMEPRILGGPQGMMLGTVIEDQFTQVFNWPLGAALSFILLATVLGILAAGYSLLRGRLQLT